MSTRDMNSSTEFLSRLRAHLRSDRLVVVGLCSVAVIVLARCTAAQTQHSPQDSASSRSWPRTAITAQGDRVTLSSPHVDEWRDGTLFVKCATRVQLHGATDSCIGTVNICGRSMLDHHSRDVTVSDLTLPAMRFPTDEAGIVPIRDAVMQALFGLTLRIPLDDLLASMNWNAMSLPVPAPHLPHRLLPADALAMTTPAEFQVIVPTALEGCTNSTSPLFRIDTGVYYIVDGGEWYSCDGLDTNSWSWVDPSTLPTALSEIPEHSRWEGALAHLPSTGQFCEAQFIRSLTPVSPPPGADLSSWWNPWEGSWWSSRESAAERSLRLDAHPRSVTDALTVDPSQENLFIGLDGRVYAHRENRWYQNKPDGDWVEYTEQRSTARLLRDALRAREAARHRRTQFESWRRAQEALDEATPNTSSQEHLSMQTGRPSCVGMRHTARPSTAAKQTQE
ncbi:MAG: hypothetical protein EXS15_03850 [Phycisphaerales bacterium]|nr:hypothetical protein [Phycisphaerales bacterium]